MHKFRTVAMSVSLATLMMFAACLAPAQSTASTLPSIEELMDDIDSDRLASTISDLEAFGTRAFYLDQSHEAAEYIFERFSQLGLEVEYQNFSAGPHPTTNVVATHEGLLDPDTRYLIGAHYDSENGGASSLLLGQNLPAPGADDDASGIAAMVEIATVVHQLDLNYTVKFVAFGAEEGGYDRSGGLKGSFHFVGHEIAENASYDGTAIIDMIGYRGTEENHATLVINENNQFANSMTEAVVDYDLNVTLSQVMDPSISYSDHYPFWVVGYPSVLVCEAAYGFGLPYEFNPSYHSAEDTLDKLSLEQMTEVSKAILGGLLSLNGFASSDNGIDVMTVILLLAVVVVIAAVIVIYISKVKK